MATVRFYIRSTASNTKKLANIQCRLRDGRKVDLYAPTGLNAHPDFWDNAKECVINSRKIDYVHEVNMNLGKLKNHILTQYTANAGEINKLWLSDIIDRFNNPEKYQKRKLTLFDFIQDFIEKAPTRPSSKTDKPVCYKQIREYERTFFHLKEFAKSKKRKIDFSSITLDFYHDFVNYLQSEKTVTRKDGTKIKEQGLAQNTIGKKIQTLKIFLNAATDNGLNENNQFKSHRFKAMTEETESIYLTETEIQKLYDLDLAHSEKLEKVRDLFIIGCWTGLRYSDWDKVTPQNIDDGFLTLKQSKTGGEVVIPLHEMVLAIMEKYNGTLPPVISNQKFNDYLKDVAKAAELNGREQKSITKGGVRRTVTHEKWELVTTHTGRRSFATNLYKAGFPSLSIMQVTGHKTEAAFLKYIKVTPREHAQKLKEFWQNRPIMKIAN